MSKNKFETLTNERVTKKFQKVRIINSGEYDGVTNSLEALSIAKNEQLDLILVNGKPNPAICMIADYKKYLYDAKKREKQQNKPQAKTKTIQLGLDIQEHDIQTNVNKALKFLAKKHKVKITLLIKGWRNMARKDSGKDVILDFVERVNNLANFNVAFENEPKFSGRSWTATIYNKNK